MLAALAAGGILMPAEAGEELAAVAKQFKSMDETGHDSQHETWILDAKSIMGGYNADQDTYNKTATQSAFPGLQYPEAWLARMNYSDDIRRQQVVSGYRGPLGGALLTGRLSNAYILGQAQSTQSMRDIAIQTAKGYVARECQARVELFDWLKMSLLDSSGDLLGARSVRVTRNQDKAEAVQALATVLDKLYTVDFIRQGNERVIEGAPAPSEYEDYQPGGAPDVTVTDQAHSGLAASNGGRIQPPPKIPEIVRNGVVQSASMNQSIPPNIAMKDTQQTMSAVATASGATIVLSDSVPADLASETNSSRGALDSSLATKGLAYLQKGKIVFVGTPDEVAARRKIVARKEKVAIDQAAAADPKVQQALDMLVEKDKVNYVLGNVPCDGKTQPSIDYSRSWNMVAPDLAGKTLSEGMADPNWLLRRQAWLASAVDSSTNYDHGAWSQIEQNGGSAPSAPWATQKRMQEINRTRAATQTRMEAIDAADRLESVVEMQRRTFAIDEGISPESIRQEISTNAQFKSVTILQREVVNLEEEMAKAGAARLRMGVVRKCE